MEKGRNIYQCLKYCLADTIDHYLYECALVQKCWQHFYSWWNRLHGVNMNLQTLYIFGIPNVDNDVIMNAFYFCIRYVKYYVYKCKINSLHLCFEKFKIHLRDRLEYEICIAVHENNLNRFLLLWNTVVDNL